MSKPRGGNGNNKEESVLEQLLKAYPKRFSKAGIPMYKQFDQKIKALVNDGGDLVQLHLWDEAGPNGTKLVFETLKQVNLNTIRSIRLWKIKACDEGIRSLCEYLTSCNLNVEIMDLLDNSISPLGCQFLGSMYLANWNTLKINRLSLDHNAIGDEGLKQLSTGLRKSVSLAHLSLSYCNLSSNASQSIQQILAFVDSNLESLNLQGNMLKEEGSRQILRAVEVNSKLRVLNLTDNQICDEKMLIDQILKTIEKNSSMYVLTLNHNGFTQETAKQLLDAVKVNMRPKIELTERFDAEFASEFNNVMMKIKMPKETKKPSNK